MMDLSFEVHHLLGLSHNLSQHWEIMRRAGIIIMNYMQGTGWLK
jgi:hypothetical protein